MPEENLTKNILLVEDAALERELLIEVLRSAGIKNNVLETSTGDEAIEILGRKYHDICVILLDWQMPEMSGLEFMAGVVKVSSVAHIPIIMVTASGTEEDQKKAKDVNPNLAGYITKPYEPEDLIRTITPFLK